MVLVDSWLCGACAGSNPGGTRFCGHCGTPLEARDAAPTDPVGPAADLDAVMRRFVPKALAQRLQDKGGEISQESRLVTALFADVSGFTALSTRVDAETLAAIIDPVIARISAIVGRYEGYINSFAGDAILALFGAPVGHEDDADRALMAASEMHEAVAVAVTQLHEAGGGLKLHIGVNTGHVVARLIGDELRTDYSVLGESVNVAQRLEAAAPNGETYVGAMTWQLTRDRFTFEPVGELTVKGRDDPVQAWRLVGPQAGSAVGSAQRDPSARLIGRAEELASIERVVAGAAAGTGGVICLTGEPGVGKSRLRQEAAQRAAAQGVHWIDARCISYGAGVAYFPYAELFRGHLGITFDQDLAVAARHLAGQLREMGLEEAVPFFTRMLGLPTPEGARSVEELEPDAFRRGLHDAVGGWFRVLASTQPIVLAVDDLHWADPASFELTRHLVTLSQDAPVVLLLSARPEIASRLDELAAAVAPEHRVALALGRLDASSTSELVDAVLGGPAPPELLAAVVERAAGNPFFVQELVRSLAESGDVVFAGTRWSMRPGWEAAAIPPTVEEVLSGRIDMLPAVAAQVLQVASVIGRRVNPELLGALAEDVTDLHGVLEQLVAGGFLDRVTLDGDAVLMFHHALVLDVAYGRLIRRQRRELHRRVAETAETLWGSADDIIELLARHFYLAEAGAKAVDYLVKAADRARRLFANEEGILHLERAVELSRANARLHDNLATRLLELAELHDLTGRYEAASELYEEVRSATNDVRAWRGMASIARRRGDGATALALVDRALGSEELVGADVSSLWLERAWTLVAEGRFAEAIQATDAALAAAPDPSDPVVGHLLLQRAQAETWTGRLDDAHTHAAAARQIFQDIEDLHGVAVALRVLGNVQIEAGSNDDAVETLLQGLELAERTGGVDEVIGCLVNLGLVELRRENLDLAIEYDLRALAAADRIGHAVGAMIAQVNLGEMLLERGDLENALAACEQALEMATAIDDTQCIADAHRIASVIHLREDRLERSLAAAKRAAALFLEIGNAVPAAQALEVASEAAGRLGDVERARSLSDQARQIVTQGALVEEA